MRCHVASDGRLRARGAGVLSRQLVQAYLATAYQVRLAADPVTLTIGPLAGSVRRWLARRSCRELVVVTAANPVSRPLGRWPNQSRNQALQAWLRRKGWQCLPAAGVPLRPGWEAEESLAIVGMSVDAGAAAGRRFGQNAIVHASILRGVRLILLR